MANKPKNPYDWKKKNAAASKKQVRDGKGRFGNGLTGPKPGPKIRVMPVAPKLHPPVSQQLAALRATQPASQVAVMPTVRVLRSQDPGALAIAVESAVRKPTSAGDRAAIKVERALLVERFGQEIDWNA